MIITIHAGENFREALAGAGVSFDCGGNGSCGKCRVCVVEGSAAVSDADRAIFGAEELAEGWRLGCRLAPIGEEELKILLPEGGADIQNLSAKEKADFHSTEMSDRNFSFAIDIGTTTIVIAAIDMDERHEFDRFACMNSQRLYGADVVSRIVASNNGFGAKLKDLVIGDINRGIETVMARNGLRVERLERIVLTGNTTMEHIFAGLSCEGLGTAPFTPVTLDAIQTGSGLLLPGISAFVGADVLSGMSVLEGFSTSAEAGGRNQNDDENASGAGKQLSLYIDLGTNGEMALGDSERILVASTAAGPAFEGGNISCGCAGTRGAICDVELSDEDDEPIRLRLAEDGLNGDDNSSAPFVSAGECEPAGICGSGAIALLAELLDEGIVDETGLLDDRLNGRIRLAKGITFTQKDIREIQLAKAAVRAGAETLIYKYGAGYSDIKTVYLAGSFGRALDVAKAARIGLIPKELKSKCVAVGNTALEGTISYILNEDAAALCMERIKAAAEEIVLADSEFFGQQFMENMNFRY